MWYKDGSLTEALTNDMGRYLCQSTTEDIHRQLFKQLVECTKNDTFVTRVATRQARLVAMVTKQASFSQPSVNHSREKRSEASMAEEKVGSLEEEAFKRKERIQALKRKVTEEEKEQEPVEASNLPKPKFRSYKPQDSSLQDKVLDNAKPGDVENEVKEQLSAAYSKVVIEELDISSLAPRKPDWDLKRDVAKKLEKLERRTQKAIAELIRERLKQGQEDLATIVNMAPVNTSKKKLKATSNEEE